MHALLPVIDEVLQLGPGDQATPAWVWGYSGTTQPLRPVAEDVVISQKARVRHGLAAEHNTFRVTFSVSPSLAGEAQACAFLSRNSNTA
jgi:hypothetical protein